MLNFRKIDRFYLSGGWQDLPRDIELLKIYKIKAILDLQFTGLDSNDGSIAYIAEELNKDGIDYKAIKMRDDELNLDLAEILSAGSKFLAEMEEKYPKKSYSILVKCAAGISRSPTMLINYLCDSRQMSYIDALNYLREKEYNQGVEFGSSPYYFFADYLKKRYP